MQSLEYYLNNRQDELLKLAESMSIMDIVYHSQRSYLLHQREYHDHQPVLDALEALDFSFNSLGIEHLYNTIKDYERHRILAELNQ